MERREDVTEGMIVRSRDGKKLGSVVRCNSGTFQIEKGIFFPEEYLADYQEINEVREGEIFLKLGQEKLKPFNPVGLDGTGLPESESSLEAEPLGDASKFPEQSEKRRCSE